MLFQFRIGRIPVQVHASHLLIAGLFGWMFASGDVPEGSSPRARTAVLVSWVGIIFVSVLFHELGHALVSRAFGFEPLIQLIGMGGLTHSRRQGPSVWWRDVLITLAGPMFGLALGLGCFLALLARPEGMTAYVLKSARNANLFWTAMNLLPVTPLDGGKIASTLCVRLFGRRGVLVAQILALLVAGAAVAYGASSGYQIVALMFAWYGFAAVQGIAAYFRGDAQIQTDPQAPALVEAATAYRDGKLEHAERTATAALEKDPTPPVRARLHHLLGWIGLKNGQGRAALDHFAQVQGMKVEPQALAAGFSLLGDDARALALWEHAFRESGDKTVLHEWAGALIRLGRVEDAKRLKGVDLAAAYACAERVQFIRGDFDAAAKTGEEALALAPTAERAYDTACAFARAGKTSDAMRLLQRAASLGYRDREHAAGDEDLSALRQEPEFQLWLTALKSGLVTRP